jgi:hypothetical protein
VIFIEYAVPAARVVGVILHGSGLFFEEPGHLERQTGQGRGLDGILPAGDGDQDVAAAFELIEFEYVPDGIDDPVFVNT